MSFQTIYAADHRGVYLKKILTLHAKATRQSFQDVGINVGSLLDYVDVSKRVAEEMFFHPNAITVSVCRRGYAFPMALNRFPHIRAFTCTSVSEVVYARIKFDANALCLGNDVVTPELACTMVEEFLKTPFSEGKHLHCVQKLSQLRQEDFLKPITKRSVILSFENRVLLCEEKRSTSEESTPIRYVLPSVEVSPYQPNEKPWLSFLSQDVRDAIKSAKFLGVFKHFEYPKESFRHELLQLFHLNLAKMPGSIFANPTMHLNGHWCEIEALEAYDFASEKLKQVLQQVLILKSSGFQSFDELQLEV